MSFNPDSLNNEAEVSEAEGDETEPKLGEVYVYAVEETRREESHVTRQGFGYSTPLEKPETEIRFAYSGQFYTPEAQRRQGWTGGARNARENLKSLAISFSENYLRSRGNEEKETGKKTDFTFKFDPAPDTEKGSYSNERKSRSLTPEEQEEFLEAFREANKESVAKEATKKITSKSVKKTLPPPAPKRKK
ncbi:MAG: hypothetical protein A2312_01395 [Candidatus Staskawiczbacteria bacterium RIFOXYB2_FULL_32_9]|uniref:Uncharacterized protein n=1 Tax=Candidatus Staskawiczbacteria bacterium RIFOXYD1_FULL_32_13 TaxID=1802234 RepID=A0A1G2JNI6_9BACT|nr:MAG: hypothetical protein UR22_C0002G0005 [Parcubacteria group bacterium GW2011_GWC2_32_10]OGZ77623.1 MAG: hypothetical protein A2256_01395 [Candidatus Staskawiczbacteria bacterium RIFOXYA2_FULL_32_7]OGZ78120.1 MAG: hypothetical protein A2360_00760 [Candidatus Staskawiczbacteria bacterium RIFOXYB1_FULL_32_11]OGZ82018.1 MAG: hypothetical protein A2312_01395 [Candidatus Staskawiczbacteria bacterium RIFOXYB2_FULL_32_9]OGZ88704.1 MAG: hypothetical protein A2561_02985 [Candidatus Staskawiczbacter